MARFNYFLISTNTYWQSPCRGFQIYITKTRPTNRKRVESDIRCGYNKYNLITGTSSRYWRLWSRYSILRWRQLAVRIVRAGLTWSNYISVTKALHRHDRCMSFLTESVPFGDVWEGGADVRARILPFYLVKLTSLIHGVDSVVPLPSYDSLANVRRSG